MKKADLLKLAVLSKRYEEKNWITNAFAVSKPAPNKQSKYLDIIYGPVNVQVITGDGNFEVVTDADPKEPLFSFKDRVLIDSNWCANVREPLETSIGNLIFNLCCMVPNFGTKLPFVSGKVKVSAIEDKIAPILKDDDEYSEEDKISIFVSEYTKFLDSLQYITELSQLCVYAATEKNIQSAPGIQEYRSKLIKEYGDKLNDLTILKEFEQKLQDYDEEYLKDDPTNGVFLSGKTKNVARKKLFIMIGTETGFSGNQDIKPILTSLSDGWNTEPETFTAMMNATRSGSFSRGAETVKGGVAAKVLLRAGSNFKVIVDSDCKTDIGFTRVFTEFSKKQLEGRYVKIGSSWKLVKDEADITPLLNKAITIRSPMYCKLEGDRVCKLCAGEKLSQIPTGLTIPITDISFTLLYTSMGAMHGKALLTTEIDINKILS